jgi:DNA-binding protein Fis
MVAHLKFLEHQGLRVSSGSQGDVFGDMYEEFLEAVERPLLESMMRAFQNNRATIAAQLGLHRSTLRQKLRRYKIDR